MRLLVSIIFYSMFIVNVLEPLRDSGYIIAALVFLSVVCFGLKSECDFPVWTNGCSVPLNLPFFYKKKFTTACNHHDVCYHCVSSARSTGIFCFFVLPYCLTYIQFCIHVHNHSVTEFDNTVDYLTISLHIHMIIEIIKFWIWYQNLFSKCKIR